MKDLGALEGEHSYAIAISDSGQVVGHYEYSRTKSHAFIWENGTMRDMCKCTGYNSIAVDINNSGNVVGLNSVDVGSFGDFVPKSTESNILYKSNYDAYFLRNGMAIDLLGDLTTAYAVNDNGQVLGVTASSESAQVYVWEEGKVTPINDEDEDTFSFFYTTGVYDINNRGQVAGSSNHGGYIWFDNKFTFTKLNNPNADYQCAPRSINDNEQIVGINDGGACFWEDGTVVPLFAPTGYCEYCDSRAYSINNNGQAVGFFKRDEDYYGTATLWEIKKKE